jgi:predicted glycosyltransferase
VSRSGSPRLAVYSQDGLGLGHQRRTTLLASEFLAAKAGASVLTISDSPLGQFFSTSMRHDYLKLPSIHKVGPGDWRPLSLPLSFPEVLNMRRELIRSAVLNFAPDVVLVDHMPHGAMGELIPTLEALKSTATKVVLGLRDILDSPAVVRRRWRLEGAFDAVERYFHDVLVYGSRDVFDVSAEYGWPERASRRLRYCGYVCAASASASRADKLRKRYVAHGSDDDLIVAMAGGGADADALFTTLLTAVPAISAQRPCVVVIVTGPFLPRAEQKKLVRLARGLPVHFIQSVHNSLTYLSAADLVIAMAGYNTTAEILTLDKPALLVPRSGPSAEQQMRAKLFADRGWVSWLPPERLSPGALAEAAVTALATGHHRTSSPDLRGRHNAAMHLLTRLEQAARDGTEPLTADVVSSPGFSPVTAPDAQLQGQRLRSGG